MRRAPKANLAGLLLAGAVVVTAVGASTESLAQEYSIKFGHLGVEGDGEYEAVIVFKEYVESHSDGRIEVQNFPNGQLGTYRGMIEGLQLGGVEMVYTSSGGISSLFPEIQVAGLPYVFRNEEVAHKVFDGWFVDELRDAVLEKTGTVRLLVAATNVGFRNFATTTKLVKSPEDLNGLKIRTAQSQLQVKLVEALGGDATPIPWAELYTALATGVVDGTKNAIPDIVNFSLDDHIEFYTLDGHAHQHGYYWINNDFFNNLPDDLKRVVIDGGYVLQQVSRTWPMRTRVDAFQAFRDHGGTIYVPTDEEMEAFKEAAAPVREWFVQEYGDHWVKLLDQAITDAEAEIEAEYEAHFTPE